MGRRTTVSEPSGGVLRAATRWLPVLWVLPVMGGLGMTACDSQPPEQSQAQVAVPPTGDAPAAPEPQSIYDLSGNLRESGEAVAGLPLPLGLDEVRHDGRSHVYRSEVPLSDLRRFFSARLTTGQIDEPGRGVVFRQAMPNAARGALIPLDVSLLPSGANRVRVEVRELPPAPDVPPTEAEIRERLQKVVAEWD